jgi:hypothetical protein
MAPFPFPTYFRNNLNQQGGNFGVLVFNSDKGWPEDRSAALRDVIVPRYDQSTVILNGKVPPGRRPDDRSQAAVMDLAE